MRFDVGTSQEGAELKDAKARQEAARQMAEQQKAEQGESREATSVGLGTTLGAIAGGVLAGVGTLGMGIPAGIAAGAAIGGGLGKMAAMPMKEGTTAQDAIQGSQQVLAGVNQLQAGREAKTRDEAAKLDIEQKKKALGIGTKSFTS